MTNLLKNKNRIYTKNLAPGKSVYGERLVKKNNAEYREWDPKRSKLGSAIVKGIENPIKEGDVVLYLGSASGTTCSHVSDLVGMNGFVFALDFAPRVVRDLVYLCEQRKNMAPLLEDANKPEDYREKVTQVDVIFQDIAQRNQVQIFMKNVREFLKPGGIAIIAIKARSIDVTQNPRIIFDRVRRDLKKKTELIEHKNLEPFQRDHRLFVCKKKN